MKLADRVVKQVEGANLATSRTSQADILSPAFRVRLPPADNVFCHVNKEIRGWSVRGDSMVAGGKLPVTVLLLRLCEQVVRLGQHDD